jgi:hypothetical protein
MGFVIACRPRSPTRFMHSSYVSNGCWMSVRDHYGTDCWDCGGEPCAVGANSSDSRGLACSR